MFFLSQLLCTVLTPCIAAENESAVLRCIFLSDRFSTGFVWDRVTLVIYLFSWPYLQFKCTVKSYLRFLGL